MLVLVAEGVLVGVRVGVAEEVGVPVAVTVPVGVPVAVGDPVEVGVAVLLHMAEPAGAELETGAHMTAMLFDWPTAWPGSLISLAMLFAVLVLRSTIVPFCHITAFLLPLESCTQPTI
jgi:hypothetical protein